MLKGKMTWLTCFLVCILALAACAPVGAPTAETDSGSEIMADVAPDRNVETMSTLAFARMANAVDIPLLADNGDELGQIQDYVIDLASGRLTYVVASFDTFDTVEGELFPIPLEYIRIDPTSASLRVGIDQQVVNAAPRLVPEMMPLQDYTSAWDSSLRTYWMNAVAPQQDLQGDVPPQPVPLPYYRYGVGIRMLPTSVVQYSDFRHQAVTNPENEMLGQIEDFVFDRLTGEIPYMTVVWDPATLAPDAFLDGNLSMLPLGTLTWNAQDMDLVYDLTPGAMVDAPRFAADTWPNLSVGDWYAELQSYWTGVDTAVALRAGVRIVPDAVMRAANVLGRSVVSVAGEDLGMLEDLVIDTEDGAIVYAVLNLSGFFELEDIYHVVPANSLTLDPATSMAILGIDRATLEDSPTLDPALLGEIATTGWDSAIEDYWHDWIKPFSDDESTAAAASEQVEVIPSYVSVKTLVGYGVQNSNGDDLGVVRELMLNLTQGQVAYAVLSFGGFVGIGDKLFAVPMSLLTPDLNLNNQTIVFNVEPAQLEEAQGFDQNNWPEMGNARWRAEVNEYWSDQF